MDNRTLKTPYIDFVGSSANEVTGSAYLIRYMNLHILVDYGLRQTSNDKDDYIINSKRHKDIKPKRLDAIILTHCHIDHCGLVPKLYKEGCKCTLYVPKGTKSLLTIMWQDCLKIFTQEYERFERKPLYDQEDIDNALNHIKECELNQTCILTEDTHKSFVAFTYYNAQHIVKARQIYFTFNDGTTVKHIGFTGDISNYKKRYYLQPLDKLPHCDALVGECTYSDSKRLHKERDRRTDINKLDTAIKFAKEHKSKVIIPTFSLNRLQDILTVLYEMYGNNPPLKIIVDSPLGQKISNTWEYLIENDDKMWRAVSKWDKIMWISDFKDSLAFSKLQEPLIVLAGGGMVSGGRATFWCKECLSNPFNYIVFTGYSTPESVAGQIKSGEAKYITIDGKKIKSKAKTITLNSFSSHCDYRHLMDYYSEVSYNKICLVHSEQESKIKFAKDLRENLSELNRSSKVVVINKDTKVYF